MAVAKGFSLGAVNVVVVGVVMAMVANDSDVAVLVVMIGGIPGVIAGALLGGLAALLESATPRLRVVVLTAAAISVVAVLAAVFRMEELIAPCPSP